MATKFEFQRVGMKGAVYETWRGSIRLGVVERKPVGRGAHRSLRWFYARHGCSPSVMPHRTRASAAAMLAEDYDSVNAMRAPPAESALERVRGYVQFSRKSEFLSDLDALLAEVRADERRKWEETAFSLTCGAKQCAHEKCAGVRALVVMRRMGI